MRLSAVISAVFGASSMFAIAVSTVGCGDKAGTGSDADLTSDMTSMHADSDATSTAEGMHAESSTDVAGMSDGEGVSSTAQEPELTPAEQAAALACAARETTSAIEIPAPQMGIGFAFSEYPARFSLDFAQAEEFVFEGDMWCHVLQSDCLDCECPLNECTKWMDPDGEMRIHMATRGIDYVEFYGSEEPDNGEPFAPLTPSVRYDVDDQCPELPQVWTIDPEGRYRSTQVVCMHHAEDLAEVVFVRLP